MPTPPCVVPRPTPCVVQISTRVVPIRDPYPSCVLHNLIPSPVFYRSSPPCVLQIAILVAVLYGSPIPVYYPPCVLPSDDMTKLTTASPVTPTRPIALPPALATVPHALRGSRAWVGWRFIHNGERWTKVPFDPRTGQRASCADPATWAPFGDAVTAYRHGGYDGIGLQLTRPLIGVDLDGCRRPDTGQLTPWAVDVVRELATYTEISPSERGLHLLATGTLPAGWRRLADPRIEVYDSGRFFTVSGQHLAGTPLTVLDRADALAVWHTRLDGHRSQASAASGASVPQGPSPWHASQTLTDAQLLAKATGAANGATFERLWYGAWDGACCPSQSEADLALCGILAFWTGRDAQRIDRLFRASGLYRSKWDVRHFADGRTYGERTVALAVASAHSVWSPRWQAAGRRERPGDQRPT